MTALGAGLIDVAYVVRTMSACFIAVYAGSTAAGIRLLDGLARRAAQVALMLVAVVAVFFGAFLAYPAAIALAVAIAMRRRTASGAYGPASST